MNVVVCRIGVPTGSPGRGAGEPPCTAVVDNPGAFGCGFSRGTLCRSGSRAFGLGRSYAVSHAWPILAVKLDAPSAASPPLHEPPGHHQRGPGVDLPQQRHTKAEAEAVLRELPSVLGAFVREDVYGHPREVHILVKAGTVPRDLARDVRELLEERLGVPVDQRVISIAQVAENGTTLEQAIGPAGEVAEAVIARRVVLLRVDASRTLGWIEARAVVQRGEVEFEGAAREVEAPTGAPRAGGRGAAAARAEGSRRTP